MNNFSEQPSIRDVLENRYLHEWLHTSAVRRCKEILKYDNSVRTRKFGVYLFESFRN
jgi:hypothetical protein